MSDDKYVTREEFERKYNWLKRGLHLAFWAGMIALFCYCILAINSRADSTVPRKIQTFKVSGLSGGKVDSISWWVREDESNFYMDLPPLYFFKLDGKWIQIAIVVDSLPPMHKDTIPVVPARGLDSMTSGPAPRIKSSNGSAPGLYTKPHPQFGLDSAFDIHEKIWWYFDWKNGKRTNLRRAK